MNKIKIRLIKRVTSDLPVIPSIIDMIIAEPGEYEANTNQHGALWITIDGQQLGIKPSEFDFLEAPAWVLEKHGKLADLIGRDTLLSEILEIIDKKKEVSIVDISDKNALMQEISKLEESLANGVKSDFQRQKVWEEISNLYIKIGVSREAFRRHV